MSNSWERVLDERKKLVEKIIENMKQGYVLPKPNWDKGAFISGQIENPVSHARYRGVNYVKLYINQMENRYTDGRYMTYKQAQSMGWQVKKGEVGIRLEKYIFEKAVEEKNEETGKIEKKKVPLQAPIVNQFVVFHASQINGIPEIQKEEIKPLPEDAAYSIAENFMKSSECPIIETSEGRAYYSPSRDEIHLPYRDAFLDSQSFLATELHEMIHSTGATNRLNRNLNGGFGSVDYAKEELRAELGSFFVQTDMKLNFDAQHYNSHTQYLESWISVLENDPNELFRAISDAQKASDYLKKGDALLKVQEIISSEALTKQEEASIRVAIKRELNTPNNGKTGKEHLENWLLKQAMKEKELGISITNRENIIQAYDKAWTQLMEDNEQQLIAEASVQQQATELMEQAEHMRIIKSISR